MYITLKMKIQDAEIDLEVNLTNRAGRIYRQQYNRDLIKDMSDIYKKLVKSPFEGVDLTGLKIVDKTETEIYDQIMERMDVAKMMTTNDQIVLDFEDAERAGQIIWAFVKNRDEKLPNYEEWIDSFDFVFPVEKIIPALYDAWGKSAQPTIELKN